MKRPLIGIRAPVGIPPHAQPTRSKAAAMAVSAATRPSVPPSASACLTEGTPLVSCVLPTCGRPLFLARAVEHFLRQDYPLRELIIIDEPAGQPPALLADPRIHYHRLPPGLSIGEKRNRGTQLARGALIVQWDDDDWYAPHYLGAQLRPILEGRADIVALRPGAVLDLPRWRFWRMAPGLAERLLFRGVLCGTLAYHRRLWDRGLRYPDRSLAEDADFLRGALAGGARFCAQEGWGLFIYVRHGMNTWRFECGRTLDPRGWQTIAEPDLPAQDLRFYRERAGHTGEQPLVSCLMPTADRRRLVPRAIDAFLRQDYPRRELVILDDGEDPVGDLVPGEDARVRYQRIPRARSLGAKRNLACEEARGELLVHWDDDDWVAPHRLTLQAGTLTSDPSAALCGLARLLFFDPWHDRAWRYDYGSGRPWVYGGTFGYRRSAWQAHRFRERNVGEDNQFVADVEAAAVRVLDDDFYVGLVHRHNTSPKRPHPPRWRSVPLDAVYALLGADLAFYHALVAGTGPTVDAAAS